MMNADVTAEKSPACCRDKHATIKTPRGTHKDQGDSQILVKFVNEFPVVFPGDFTIFTVKFGLVSFKTRRYISLPAVRRF